MFNVNEYFDGNVKSISFQTPEGRATIGVLAAGEYEFGTSTMEYMTVISGEMSVMLPGNDDWKTYYPCETFMIEKDQKFRVKVLNDTSYKCLYK